MCFLQQKKHYGKIRSSVLLIQAFVRGWKVRKGRGSLPDLAGGVNPGDQRVGVGAFLPLAVGDFESFSSYNLSPLLFIYFSDSVLWLKTK